MLSELFSSLYLWIFVSDKGSVLLNGLVDYYLDTSSLQAVDLLSSIREPHDKVRKELALSDIRVVGMLHFITFQTRFLH